MLVVCDTSPVSNLAIIGRLELLRAQFGTVRMPSTVARELAALRHATAQSAIADAVRNGWLIETPLPPSAPSPDTLHGLDAGETEALRLALSLAADAVLMDEREGRQRAVLLGLRTIGVIGVLIAAKRAGSVRSLAAEIARLRHEAGFFVDASLEARALAMAGE